MSAPLLFPMPGNEAMTSTLAKKLGAGVGAIEVKHFPDGESYVRIAAEIRDRDVAFVATLDHPDAKILPLVFAADAAHELGARTTGLVAPYLAYMRQDRRFESGEAVTSRSFAKILSQRVDWLVTVDPHLHRYGGLSELYNIPTRVLHAASLLADWIVRNVKSPILVGPDQESRQWVSEAAARIGAPFTVLDKIRRGDRDVTVRLADDSEIGNRTPVLVDDILASGETMLEAARVLHKVTVVAPVCVAVHGIFAEGARAAFEMAKLRVVTTNTVAHPSSAIDVSDLLAAGVAAFLPAGRSA